MKVPLEILQIVILQAEAQYTHPQLLQLRLVNSTFDREVLSRLFSDYRPKDKLRFISGRTWDNAPPSLRQKYLRFRLRLNGGEPSLFAYLFLPVYRKRLADLGITEHEDERREDVLNQLLQFIQPNRHTARVIAHKSRNIRTAIDHVFRISRKSDDEDNGLKQAHKAQRVLLEEALREKHVHDEYQFVRICCAIIEDDIEIISTVFNEEEALDLSRRSICFGTTIFKFALSRGSIKMLRFFLTHKPGLIVDQGHQYDLFTIAAERSDSAKEAVTLLLQLSNSLFDPIRRRNMLEFYFRKAGEHCHLPVLKALLDWLDQNWRPETLILPQLDTGNNYAALETAVLWFNDAKCRYHLLQCAYAHIHCAKPLPQSTHLYWHSSDIKPYSPHRVKQRRKPDIAFLYTLLENGVDVDCWTIVGSGVLYTSPLFMSVWRGYIEWAEVLVQLGVKPWGAGGISIIRYAQAGGILEEFTDVLVRCGYVVNDIWVTKR